MLVNTSTDDIQITYKIQVPRPTTNVLYSFQHSQNSAKLTMLRKKEKEKSDRKGGKKTDTQSCLVSLLSGLKLYSQTNKCIKILIKKKNRPCHKNRQGTSSANTWRNQG
jgi:hypothetical protein